MVWEDFCVDLSSAGMDSMFVSLRRMNRLEALYKHSGDTDVILKPACIMLEVWMKAR